MHDRMTVIALVTKRRASQPGKQLPAAGSSTNRASGSTPIPVTPSL